MEAAASTRPVPPLLARRLRIDKYNIAVGPLGHLADERQRLDALQWQHFEVKRLGATIGAELHGLDLTAELPDPVIDEIRRALHAYKVVFFRRQPLSAAQHVAFARRFGELEIHPFIPSNTGQPELVRFEKSADVGGFENGWHHDVTWRECPSMGAVLHAIHVPPTGGDTLFADMHAAYEGLDEETRARIDDMVAVHDYAQVFGRVIPAEQREAMRAQYPLVEHPVVCSHPATGRPHLYVNRFFASHIVGLDADESTALIDRLSRQADILEYQCRFQWEPDSVAFWDNRAVQHYAASDYWPDLRVMERASIIGPRPAR
ncbi:MAG: TauD/TfdA family dioxygenase [Deltaproteobacteria bacterium]|nr:TauD/TfdA family dioxygenase [Deltaproteobacteria bacterium]